MSIDETLPVIVGVGHVTRRPGDPSQTTEPAELLAAAVAEAAADARLATQLDRVDSLDVINFLSWRYADPARTVAERAGLLPARAVYSPVGGDQPTLLLAGAAHRIAVGHSRVAVVVGGESMASRRRWQQAGQKPPWPRLDSAERFRHLDGLGYGALEHGLLEPSGVYPLVESAHRAAGGVSLAAAQHRSGRLWAGLSQVAAITPGAWMPEVHTAEQIITPSASNRPIAHPYLKLMCAQPMVDQSAAVVMASVAEARRLGIPEDLWVYPLGAAGAKDTTEILERPTFAGSEPMQRVLLDALRSAGLDDKGADLLELYSCFPIVPKLALEALGLPDGTGITAAGGLTFYGGPFNTYMLCAAVNMVRLLRRGEGRTGLLYGNGEYVTKHHALAVATTPPAAGAYSDDDRHARQALLDRRPRPTVTTAPSGAASIEASTVLFDRQGTPARGVVIGRLQDGARFVANTPTDPGSLGVLLDVDAEPVGRWGEVQPTDQGNLFQPR